MIKIYSLILIFFLQIFAINAQFNANFGFINVFNGSGTQDPGPNPQVSGLVFTAFEAIGVSAQPSASGRFSFSGWGIGAVNGSDNYNDCSGAFSALQYYEVKVHVQSGYKLELNTIYFHMRRSSTGPRSFVVRTNQTSFATNLSASSGTAAGLAVLPGNEFFWLYDSASTSSDQKVLWALPLQTPCLENDSIVIRFYAWNAEVNSGSFSIDNVTLSGIVKSMEATLPEEQAVKNEVHFDGDGKFVTLTQNTKANWIIYNVEGKIVAQQETEKISLAGFCKGIYTVVAQFSNTTAIKKLFLP